LINIDPIRPQDAEALADLMNELERFYGGEPSELLEDQLSQIEASLFCAAPAAYVLMARDDGKPAGFATYSFLWPAAGFTTSLYLKELYVAQDYRRSGLGRQFMDELHRIARYNKCSRVEWTTDAPNEDARRFYESLGYSENASKICYRSTLQR
jgi:GNAT superfamily N-acetyltransferase